MEFTSLFGELVWIVDTVYFMMVESKYKAVMCVVKQSEIARRLLDRMVSTGAANTECYVLLLSS